MKRAAVLLLAAPAFASAEEAWPADAWEEERLDHLGQSSLQAALVFEQLFVSGRDDEPTLSEPGALADAAFGLPLGDEGGELLLGLRAGAGADEGLRVVAPYLTYRTFTGYEEWKTFFDAGVFARLEPFWAAGARLGLGVQHDFSAHLGAFAGAGASIGYGDGLHVGLDAGVGLQLRFGEPG